MSDQQTLTERIIERARRQADAAQVRMNTAETNKVRFNDSRLKSAETSQRTTIELKVIVNGRLGISTTTDPDDVDGLVERALAAAQFGSPANYELPAAAPMPQVKTNDPAMQPLDNPEMIHLGQTMLGMIGAYNPDIQGSATLSKSQRRESFANSAGASYTEEHSDLSVGAGGQLVRGQDILFADHGLSQKRRQIDTEEIAERAIEYFRMAEQIAPVQSGEMPVIFTPNGLFALLLTLMLALDGKKVLLGGSPLGGKLGQPVADPRFSLVDDPLIEYGPNSSAFDDQGMLHKVTPLIENGVLRNFIYDLETAGKAGAHPTGHGANRRFTNLVVAAGDTPYEEMLRSMSHGLLVHDFLGLGQGNPLNGEFSVNLALGYKIENGRVVGRVKDVMLAGNAYQAIKDIAAISQEREWVGGPDSYFGSYLAPYVQVNKLSVTAK